ncbi:hypothetical protein EB75_01505 [Mycobacterium sp. ST-F2]|nr:hypothetical protein EB75_01505 [Mycobacterium sp. ST-F2]
MLFMHGEYSQKGIIIMKKNSLAAVVTGLAAGALAVAGIALAAPALADSDGSVALPGPVPVYAQDSFLGGANPYVPFGTNPMVPYGTWAQH